MFLLVMFGVELWMGLQMFIVLGLFSDVDGNRLSELVSIEVLLVRMLLNMFLVMIMLYLCGLVSRCMVIELISWCFSVMFGNFLWLICVVILCYRCEVFSMLVLFIEVILL